MPSLNTGNAILSNPIKVDSSYNVGIGGAASGSFKLQVTGTTNLTGALTGTSATFSGAVEGTIFNSTSNAFRFSGSNALSLVTLAGQNVVKINAAGYWGVQLVGANDQGLLINNTGNVGIGTSSPQLKLDIQTGSLGAYHNTASSGGAQIYLGDMNFAGGAYATSAPGIGAAYNSSQAVAGDLAFYIYASTASSRNEAMRIKGGTGNVGIGTSSPSNILTVQANDIFNQDSSGQIVIRGASNTAKRLGIGFDTTNNYAYLQAIEAGVATRPLVLQPFGGNVGIGTSDPSGSKLRVEGGELRVTTTNLGVALYRTGSSGEIAAYNWGGNAFVPLSYQASEHIFGIAGTERMRITSGGSLCINATSSGALNPYLYNFNGDGSRVNATFEVSVATPGFTSLAFRNPNGLVGSIAINTSTVTYGGTSDYRLKEDLKDFNGLDKVCAIKVYDFKWKASEERNEGVLAHELMSVIPYAVNGEKDDIYEDGTIKSQMVDYSKLVPVLVKAIQELNQTVQNQQQQINSLINR